MRSVILQLHNDLKTKKYSKYDLYLKYSSLCKDKNDANSMISFYEHTQDELNIDLDNADLLDGIPYVLKDNMDVINHLCTSGSSFLSDYISPYNSSVFERLSCKHHGTLVGKSNMDEFGMGGTGLSGLNGQVRNLYNPLYITGGSSSGSANLVGGGLIPFALATDTGDSARRPASFCNCVGYKPTYGLISRYGVSSYAPSLDTVGIMASSICDIAIVADALFGVDEKDFTSLDTDIKNVYKNLKTLPKLRFGAFKNIDKFLDEQVLSRFRQIIDILKNNGHEIVELEIDNNLLEIIGVTYNIISCSEAASCWSNLTGIGFGKKEKGDSFADIAIKSRSKNIGLEAKERFVRSYWITQKEDYNQVFLKSEKIRRWIVNKWNELLAGVDCIMFMGSSTTAPSIESIINKTSKSNCGDDVQVLANFAGTPSITIPCGFINKLPIGLNLNCQKLKDQQLLNIALTLEELFDKEFNEKL